MSSDVNDELLPDALLADDADRELARDPDELGDEPTPEEIADAMLTKIPWLREMLER